MASCIFACKQCLQDSRFCWKRCTIGGKLTNWHCWQKMLLPWEKLHGQWPLFKQISLYDNYCQHSSTNRYEISQNPARITQNIGSMHALPLIAFESKPVETKKCPKQMQLKLFLLSQWLLQPSWKPRVWLQYPYLWLQGPK